MILAVLLAGLATGSAKSLGVDPPSGRARTLIAGRAAAKFAGGFATTLRVNSSRSDHCLPFLKKSYRSIRSGFQRRSRCLRPILDACLCRHSPKCANSSGAVDVCQLMTTRRALRAAVGTGGGAAHAVEPQKKTKNVLTL